MWSIVRLTNSGIMPRSVRVEVYREDGTRLPIGPMFEVAPGATRDVRIEGNTTTFEACWAEVSLADDVSARGIVEVLQGNELQDFSREPHELSGMAEWVTLTSTVQEKYLYFLNAAGQPTVLTFCATDEGKASVCDQKRRAAIRFRVGGNQAVGVRVHKTRKKFLIIRSSMPGGAVLALFDDSPGQKRFFGSKSTIEFGDVER